MTLNDARVLGIRYVRLPWWSKDVYYDHRSEVLYRPIEGELRIGCESYHRESELDLWEKASGPE